ncbi:MAG: LPS export ABC transporter periplasmic protein LptC [Spirochaetae bacterium HGW-Spirochaetae-3]|jgi:LPS export ABC transporter protein LptC|nr:MAG: LPS export ABC transporter periplasmic protein LptC [Spirochaetae bacterium HGW-Spirochaetae-3]
MVKFRGVLPVVIAILSGCSLDYGAAMAEDLAADVPDTVVVGFSHTVIENGAPMFRLEAERGESFQAQKKMRLSDVRFIEYASGGLEVAAEGRADSAVFFTDTESAELSGSVRFRSARDGVSVESGYLEWDGKARLLRSRAEIVTTLSDDDGTSLSGSGFGVDAARRSFSFGNRADGRFVAPRDTE